MTKTEILERAGGGRGAVSKVAKILGISRQAVSDWPEKAPDLRVYQLKERRPDLFGDVQPAQPSPWRTRAAA